VLASKVLLHPGQALLYLLPEFVADDSQLRPLRDEPLALRALPAHALVAAGNLQIFGPIPDNPAEVELSP